MIDREMQKWCGGFFLTMLVVIFISVLAGCASLERDEGSGPDRDPPVVLTDGGLEQGDPPDAPPDSPPPDDDDDHTCRPECSCDDDCDSDEKCFYGRCYEKCSCDDDCDSDEKCRYGVCKPSHH